jgi:hypothetical protein
LPKSRKNLEKKISFKRNNLKKINGIIMGKNLEKGVQKKNPWKKPG